MSIITDALTLDAVADLSRRLGGRRLYVPTFATNGRSPPARDRLVKLVGARLAADLITNFAGTYLYIPKSTRPCRKHSTRLAVNTFPKAMSADEIAIKLGCSVRTVYDARAAKRQPNQEQRP